MVSELTEENFSEQALHSKLPIIIDFWATWCGPCIRMAPVFEDLSKDYHGKLKFAKLSVDDFPEIAEKYEVSGIPCLVLIHNGKEVDRIVGFQQKSELKEQIDAILAKI